MTGPASVCRGRAFFPKAEPPKAVLPTRIFSASFCPQAEQDSSPPGPHGQRRSLSARRWQERPHFFRPRTEPPALSGLCKALSPSAPRTKEAALSPRTEKVPLFFRNLPAQKGPHLLRTKRPPPARRGGRRSEQPPRKQPAPVFFMIPPNFSAVFRGSGRRGQVIKPASRLRAPRAACR